MQEHSGRRFVDLARFDPDEAVLDHVDPPDAVFPREVVEPVDEVDALDLRAVDRDRNAFVEADLDLARLCRRLFGVDRPLEDVARRRAPGVFEHTGLDRTAPQIHVDAVWIFLRGLDRDVVLAGIVDLLVAGHVHAPAHRRDHAEIRRQGTDREIEAHLVVALPGAAVRHETGVLGAGRVDEQLREQRTPECRRERIAVLVERAGLQRRPDEIAKEDVPGVLDDRLARATRDRLALDGLEIAGRAEVTGASDHLESERLTQPRDRDARVETARVRQNACLTGVLLAHFVPFRAMPNVVRRPRRARAWRSVVAAMKTVSSPARVPTASARRDAYTATARTSADR